MQVDLAAQVCTQYNMFVQYVDPLGFRFRISHFPFHKLPNSILIPFHIFDLLATTE